MTDEKQTNFDNQFNDGKPIGPEREYWCTPHIKTKRFTELMKLTLCTNFKIDDELLSTINFKCENGYTALMISSMNSNTKSSEETVKMLIKAKADVNLKDNLGRCTLSRSFSIYSTPNTVDILIEAKADVNSLDNDGLSLLSSLCYGEYHKYDESIINSLIKAGVNVNFTDKDYGDTALMILCRNSIMDPSTGFISILIAAKADVNLKDSDGDNALTAVFLNDTSNYINETIKILAEAKGDVNSKNDEGDTLLTIAIVNKNKKCTNETIKLLVDLGADINLKDREGRTVLMNVCENYLNQYKIETVRFLIDLGADINVIDRSRNTALSLACENQDEKFSEEVVEILLEKKVGMENADDLGTENFLFITKVMYKIIKEKEDMIKLKDMFIKHSEPCLQHVLQYL